MKTALALTLVALLADPAWTRPDGEGACCGPRGAAPWKGYTQGVRWERTPADAARRAAREKKPVFHFRLAGALDLEGC